MATFSSLLLYAQEEAESLAQDARRDCDYTSAVQLTCRHLKTMPPTR